MRTAWVKFCSAISTVRSKPSFSSLILSMVRRPAAAPGRPTARRSAGCAAPTSARGPAPASAARRRSCCRRAARRAPSAAGRSRSRNPGCGWIAERAVGRKAPSSRFSVTVSFGNSRRPSGTKPMPRSTISSVERPISSCVVPSIVGGDAAGRRPHHAHDAISSGSTCRCRWCRAAPPSRRRRPSATRRAARAPRRSRRRCWRW